MPLSTKYVTTDDAGSAHIIVPPCFFAGNDAGATFADELAGVLANHYTLATMPFIEGDLSVVGSPATRYDFFVDQRL